MRILLLLGALLYCGSLSAQPTWTIDIEDNVFVNLHDTATVGIDADWDSASSNWLGFSVGLSFDPSVLEIVSMDPGSVMAALGSGAGPDFFIASGPLSCPSSQRHFWTVGGVSDLAGAITIDDDGEIVIVNIAPASGAAAQDTSPLDIYSGAQIACTHIASGNVGPVVTVAATVLPAFTVAPTAGGSDFLSTVTISDFFIRGDCDDNGTVNIADPVRLLSALFNNNPLDCDDAGDANDSGVLDIADPIYLISYLFLSGSAPPEPFGSTACDSDPTDTDSLDCEAYTSC